MALSASYDFTLTRDDAITEALQQLGVLGAGQSPSADDLTDCALTLNLMLKSWMNHDFTQNLVKRMYVFLDPAKREYTLANAAASSDHCTTSFYRDEVATAISGVGTALEVDGTSSTNGDNIGIVLDDKTIHWDTIASGGGTTSLTLTTGFAAGDEAAVDNTVYIYTNKARRPEDIWYITTSSGATDTGQHNTLNETTTPCLLLTRERWTDLSVKDATGRVNSFWYNQDWPDASLHVWPTPDDGNDWLEVWHKFSIDDMDAASDNFALPNRWYLAVALQLALHLTPKYGASDRTYGKIERLAQNALFLAETAENEDWLQFTPDDRGR